MCDSPSQPDTSAQEAEAARQRDEQDQRYQGLLKQQQDEYTRERADDQARVDQQRADDQKRNDEQLAQATANYNQQLADQRAEAQRQYDASTQLERDRQAQEAAAEAQREQERQADLARTQAQQDKQDAEQAIRDQETRDRAASDKAYQDAQTKFQQDQADKAEAQRQADAAAAEVTANAQAEQARNYATGRQSILDSSLSQINDAYSKFDDDYYNDFAKTWANSYLPKIRQDADDANRAATFAFARAGDLDSSAAAYRFGRLQQDQADSEAQAAREGSNAAISLRGQVNAQKQNAISAVQQGIAVAPAQLPSGVSADSELSSLGSSIGSLTSSIASNANTFTPSATSGNTDFSGNFDVGPAASLSLTGTTTRSKYAPYGSSSPFASGGSTALVA